MVYQTLQGTLFGLRPVGTEAFNPDVMGLDHVSFAAESRTALEATAAESDNACIEHGEVTDLTDVGIAIPSFQDPDDTTVEFPRRTCSRTFLGWALGTREA